LYIPPFDSGKALENWRTLPARDEENADINAAVMQDRFTEKFRGHPALSIQVRRRAANLDSGSRSAALIS
jgi:hypothetical protein